MKNLMFFVIALFLLTTACDSVEDDASEKKITDDTTIINRTWEGKWFFDFNGTIDGGEAFDVIKSSVDKKIYICGAFLHVNNNWDMKNLTRWDPKTNTWEQVPGIDQYHNNFIRCITEDDEGNLYFGGDFSTIGGVKAGRVAKFNVSSGTWTALRDPDFYNIDEEYGPISGGVYAIAYLNDYIYIGGYTFNSDSAALRYIRRYHLTENNWEAVGSGVNDKVNEFCTDDNGNLYVGGAFTEAGGQAANYIAKWDGTHWMALGNGTDDYVLSLAYGNGNLYVGGSFRNVDNAIISQGIAQWSNNTWSAMSKGVYASWGNAYYVEDLCVDSEGKVYISGGFDKNYNNDNTINHVAVYNNNDWEPLDAGLGTTSSQIVMGSYADGKNVYFVGYFSKGDGDPNAKYNTAIWNETK